jgi:hypothetical protein
MEHFEEVRAQKNRNLSKPRGPLKLRRPPRSTEVYDVMLTKENIMGQVKTRAHDINGVIDCDICGKGKVKFNIIDHLIYGMCTTPGCVLVNEKGRILNEVKKEG